MNNIKDEVLVQYWERDFVKLVLASMKEKGLAYWNETSHNAFAESLQLLLDEGETLGELERRIRRERVDKVVNHIKLAFATEGPPLPEPEDITNPSEVDLTNYIKRGFSPDEVN